LELIDLNEEEQELLTYHIDDGDTIVEPEEVEERLDICEDCSYHSTDEVSNFCDRCGCLTKVRAHLMHEGCPLAKWPGDNLRDEE
jgi:hypothetical protein